MKIIVGFVVSMKVSTLLNEWNVVFLYSNYNENEKTLQRTSSVETFREFSLL